MMFELEEDEAGRDRGLPIIIGVACLLYTGVVFALGYTLAWTLYR